MRSVEACAYLCRQEDPSRCNAFTMAFKGPNKGNCRLYNKSVRLKKAPSLMMGLRSLPIRRTAPYGNFTNHRELASGGDLSKNKYVSSAQACLKLCIKKAKCSAFTYAYKGKNAGTCWLKKHAKWGRKNTNRVGGEKPPPHNWTVGDLLYKVHQEPRWPRKTKHTKASSVNACALTCYNQSTCKGFIFHYKGNHAGRCTTIRKHLTGYKQARYKWSHGTFSRLSHARSWSWGKKNTDVISGIRTPSRFEIKDGVIWKGKTFVPPKGKRFNRVKNIKACQKLCAKHRSCLAFFVIKPSKLCVLQSSRGKTVKNSKAVGGYRY